MTQSGQMESGGRGWGKVGYRAALVLVFLIALNAAWPHLMTCIGQWNDNRFPSWVGALPGQAGPNERVCDIDTYLIMQGLNKAPTLLDTRRWWTGIWAGDVPFYRPLTSYVYWMEWKAWGDYEHRYNLVVLLIHLCGVLSLTRLAYLALEHWRVPLPLAGAVLTGALFVQGGAILPSQETTASLVFSLWKNQHDALTLLFFTLSLSAYLQLRAAPRAGWRWVAPAFWYTLTCLSKESGIFLPLLALIVEAPALRDKTTRPAAIHRLAPLFGVLAVYLVVRTLALHDAIGYRYGSNNSWKFRLGISVAGNLSESLVQGDIASLGVAGVIIASVGWVALLHRQGKLPRLSGIRHVPLTDLLRVCAGPVIATLIAACFFAVHQSRERASGFDVAEALLNLFLPAHLKRGTSAALWFLGCVVVLRQRPHLFTFCYAWSLLTLGLISFSPSPLHRYYLMNAGFSLLLAASAMLWIAPHVDRLRSWTGRWGTRNAAAPTVQTVTR